MQIVGCDDPIGPADVAGAFVRTGLPEVLGRFESERVLADTFLLGADGSGARRTWVEGAPLESGAAPVIIQRSDLSFVIEGDSIGSQILCPRGRLCAGWSSGSGTSRVSAPRRCGPSMQLLALLALGVVGCGRDSNALGDQVPVRLEIERDTVIINGPRAVHVPARLVDRTGKHLPRAQWSLSVGGDSAVRVSDGQIACAGRGDAHVAVAAAGFSHSFLVRCRPVVGFGFPPPLELALGSAPQTVRVNALGPSGAIETLLAYTLSVRDSAVVAVRGGQVHPLAVGHARVVVDFGGIATAVTAVVVDLIAADTLRLGPGEFRSWPLGAGRYEITVAPVRPHASLTALGMETEGARCVRDSRSDETIHCSVRERGGLGVRNQSTSTGGPTVRAVIRVVRVQ